MDKRNWMSTLEDRHYANAPIKEAIIDIQILPSHSITLASFEGMEDAPPEGYAERNSLVMGQIHSQMKGGQLTATAKQNQLGYAFTGGNGKHVAHFKLDGFAISRLAPYETWTQLRDEAKMLWARYREIVGAVPTVRIGLRYINQLDLPSPVRDFRDFIRVYPEVSSDLPQQLSGLFLQVQIPQTDIDATLILNEVMVPPPNPSVVSIVIDIDVFKQGMQANSDEEIWNVLETLRLRKNLIFEACITNHTRELIS